MSDRELHVAYGNDRIESRQIDELIGIARGVTADGILNRAEVDFIERWLVANMGFYVSPLCRTLYDRVSEILRDDIVSAEESRELIEALSRFSGGGFELGEVFKPTTLPLCDPAPSITFFDRMFCFTGTFQFGQRKACEAEVERRGASFGSVTRKTDYLVIGAYVTDAWKHSNHGLKIEKAMEYRETHGSPAIISEEYWARNLV